MNHPFSLQGKTILITGASSGIGRAVAVECAELGAEVIITGRDASRLNETLNLLRQGNHSALTADLTQELTADLLSSIPLLDGMVHAAGVSKRLPLKFIKPNELEAIMRSNFMSAVELTRQLHKHKKIKQGSSLVYISSVASDYASLGHIMYMSSKAALNAFVRGLALELAPQQIRANAILPGMVETALSPVISDEMRKNDLANYPLGRYGKPREVALAAIYLLSDAATWVTGSFLTIDGGLTLR